MKYLRVWVLAIALAIFAAASAWAGEACYAPAQLHAEQMLRLHSELMVITVMCHRGTRGDDLATAYGAFTQKNLDMLKDAEHTLMDYYEDNAAGQSVDHLDRLRTKLGNEIGMKAAHMSSTSFCAAYRDKVLSFESASAADIEKEVEHMEIAEQAFAPSCKNQSSVLAQKEK